MTRISAHGPPYPSFGALCQGDACVRGREDLYAGDVIEGEGDGHRLELRHLSICGSIPSVRVGSEASGYPGLGFLWGV